MMDMPLMLPLVTKRLAQELLLAEVNRAGIAKTDKLRVEYAVKLARIFEQEWDGAPPK